MPRRNKLPAPLKSFLEEIRDGDFRNWEMSGSPDGSVVFQGDSPDGTQRIIIEKMEIGGYRRTTSEYCAKMPVTERREVVRRLRHEQNLTQSEIAKKLMVSQKTISNDCRILEDEWED